MTAARALAAAVLTAAVLSGCSDTGSPDVAEPAAADAPPADRGQYVRDVRSLTDLQPPVWTRKVLLGIGAEVCHWSQFTDWDESKFYDTIGITTPDRDRVTEFAHKNLCPA